jgi:hypothetical protein
VSNVPGAQAYSIYLSRGGCTGTFGLARTLPTSAAVQDNSGSCPALPDPNGWPAGGTSGASSGKNGCLLGYVVTPILDRNSYVTPSGLACASEPSSWSTGTLACAPASASRDMANQDYCLAGDGTPASCPGKVVPGAIQYFYPDGACVDINGSGATRIFSGAQFAEIVQYSTGSCADAKINGGSVTEFVGLSYLPGMDLTVNGGSGTLIQGSLIVNTLSFTGGSGVVITYAPQYLPPPPGARLVR